ncbi:MAG: hypothetical protein JGK17_06240 [Microcoleus sp. PH2017_10_PVI_O_A]|uniref:hypothetical protein n=1 Tax=unclassified Microcoleus TaxID=2642155 RepID=UPI001D1CC9DF|nr:MULTISPECIES: hypothetical protein [unclassified Microcoleus]TAF22517.1 MAG: hypothetical protein EAZ73_05525 [Oscillatoriales cyanobacterium]MCC3405186.1 hypothetical protein [Microcoleus sp. PH2017_10_PVI_O_A]MCC3459273.1 hypothetical protein [Microcoleus sp. PH2017_11_PCY_U_A]MCC3477412.1 hypothetical protein [Microcoleus sp. PH2017_12_PCY_D_A]MCC3558505.1 hypothetical protein [Microcoleus sp. PH2017_27_LUM_O_A]
MSQINPLDTFKSGYDANDELIKILVRDRTTLGLLFLKLEKLAWNEKMAVGLAAYHGIDKTSAQLIEIKPRHGEFAAPVAEAMKLLEALSPSALAELAGDILQDDFELEA